MSANLLRIWPSQPTEHLLRDLVRYPAHDDGVRERQHVGAREHVLDESACAGAYATSPSELWAPTQLLHWLPPCGAVNLPIGTLAAEIINQNWHAKKISNFPTLTCADVAFGAVTILRMIVAKQSAFVHFNRCPKRVFPASGQHHRTKYRYLCGAP